MTDDDALKAIWADAFKLPSSHMHPLMLEALRRAASVGARAENKKCAEIASDCHRLGANEVVARILAHSQEPESRSRAACPVAGEKGSDREAVAMGGSQDFITDDFRIREPKPNPLDKPLTVGMMVKALQPVDAGVVWDGTKIGRDPTPYEIVKALEAEARKSPQAVR